MVSYERNLLRTTGRDDLAERVVHVSATEGDGAGYDVRSYTDEGEVKYIEVKTTRSGANAQFFLSANELAFSAFRSEHYYLYRVYSFKLEADSGNAYILRGDLNLSLTLSPTEYRAGLRGDLQPEESEL